MPAKKEVQSSKPEKPQPERRSSRHRDWELDEAGGGGGSKRNSGGSSRIAPQVPQVLLNSLSDSEQTSDVETKVVSKEPPRVQVRSRLQLYRDKMSYTILYSRRMQLYTTFFYPGRRSPQLSF